MVTKNETKAKEVQASPALSKTIVVKHDFKKLLWVAIFGAVVWGVSQNPQIADKLKSAVNALFSQPEKVVEPSVPEQDVSVLQNEINALRSQINMLNSQEVVVESVSNTDNSEISDLKQKFDTLEKTNLNIIDSKADVSVVLGIVTRLDALEEQIKVLSKATDQSALIMTATMLVKDTADRGHSFEYEVEVLQQLATGNTKLAEPISVLEKNSRTGIVTNAQLINEFKVAFNGIMKKQKEDFDQTWKERLSSKLSEVIKVRKVNGEASPEFEANQNLINLKKLVEAEDMTKAVLELENPKNSELLKDPEMQAWLEKAKAKTAFIEAINKISMYSLAVMRVNAIKKEIKYD